MAKNVKVTIIKDSEDFDSFVRRFKREVNKADIMEEVKKRKFYIPKSLKRKMKDVEAQKRKHKRK